MNTMFFYWDIRSDKDKEYREFIFNDYLPSMSRLGVNVTDGWFLMAGEGPQIIAIGEVENPKTIKSALESREFRAIESRLQNYVENYSKHIAQKQVNRKRKKDSRTE